MGEEGSNFSFPVLNWIDGPIKQSFKNVFDGLNTGAEALDIFNKFRNKHFKMLHEKVSNIKILGMSEPTPLLQIYSPLFLSTTIHRRLYEQEIHKQDEVTVLSKSKESSKICADIFIEKYNRIAILGTAGSGKTTLLRYLALAYSIKTVFDKSNLKTPKIPFYISLLEYSKQKSLGSIFDFINNNLTENTDTYAVSYLKRIFDKGIAVVLLDAIDEVPANRRNDIFNNIKKFCESFTKCKIILTCRTADYTHSFENFYEAEISRLTQDAVNKIIKSWFVDDKAKANLLIKHISKDEGIKILTETPLLLSLVCIQFRHDLSLPKRKVELYQRCIEALLREWDTSRNFQT
jgi:predicted NACHT family NTPase